MDNPNKIYTLEYKGENQFKGTSHFVVVVAASSIEVAKVYVKDKIGIDVEPTWLMSAVYPTIYMSDGSIPRKIQAKILYNGHFHTISNIEIQQAPSPILGRLISFLTLTDFQALLR